MHISQRPNKSTAAKIVDWHGKAKKHKKDLYKNNKKYRIESVFSFVDSFSGLTFSVVLFISLLSSIDWEFLNSSCSVLLR